MSFESLIDRFLRQAEQQPDAAALVWEGRRISYGRLRVMASSARRELDRQPSACSRQPVGILARKSPASIALVLGCLMARRRCLVPAADLPPATLQALFGQAGCGRLLTADAALSHAHLALGAELLDIAGAAAPSPADGAAAPAAPEDTVFLLTTSGSTGMPKIVPLSEGAVERFTCWAGGRFAIRPGATVLSYAPLNFDLSLLEVWTTLGAGGCVLLVDPARAAQGRYLQELLTDCPVQVVQAVPMLYRLLAEAASSSGWRQPSVRHVIFTGDSMAESDLLALPRLFPSARYYNVYGCTETNDSFIHEVDLPREASTSPLPIGTPLPGVSHLIVDQGAVLEGSGTGELLVASPFQTKGYLGPGMDAGKLVPFYRDGVWRTYFRSGDLVRRDADGTLTLEGRADFHVKVRGVRVNLQEVERVILQHGEIAEGAVVAVPDATGGHRLHAAVRRHRTSRLNSLRLFQHCAAKLPRAGIPTSVLIQDHALPRTSTGKVDRRSILQSYLKRVSNDARHHR